MKSKSKGYQVVATNNPDEAGNFLPCIVIVDANTIRRNLAARWPCAKIILLDTGLEDEEIISLILNYRLEGVIKTDSHFPLFKKALKAVEEGQIWVDNSRIKALLKHSESLSSRQQVTSLSRKEREIIFLISQGRKNREIAESLCISEQTVKSHISHIFIKTNISCRSQLVPIAMKMVLPVME